MTKNYRFWTASLIAFAVIAVGAAQYPNACDLVDGSVFEQTATSRIIAELEPESKDVIEDAKKRFT